MSQIRHHQEPNLSISTRDQNVTGEKCHMIDITGTEILPVTEMSRDIIFRNNMSVGRQNDVNAAITLKNMPGAIARSVAMSLGNQEAPRSFLAAGTSFR